MFIYIYIYSFGNQIFVCVCVYFIAMASPNMMDEILSRLQNAEIVEDEKEFFLTLDDVAVSYDENKRSCVGKLIVDRDVNVQGLRCYLCKV